jgi:predicted nucleic acid-binding protein
MILDTNAISALAAHEPRLIRQLATASRIAVTLINLGEFEFGILGSSKKATLERWTEAFLERAEVLSPNMQTLTHYAAIRHELKAAGTPVPANDVWIAALVRQHNMPLVSRNRHFDLVDGIDRIEW